MRCPECFGYGRVMTIQKAWTLPGAPLVYMELPCESCGGHAIAHCCDGENVDRACPSGPPDENLSD